MLFLIGLGLSLKDVSLRAMETIRGADEVLLEQYTSFLPEGYVEFIEKEAGKPAIRLSRQDLEDNVAATVGRAKDRDVAILVPGDPLVATTHHLIINTARKLGIGVEVFHSASAFTAAIGESGLDIYKFGPTVTVPFWSENYRPTSFLDAIRRNLENKEHTLVLLDIDQKAHRPMSLDEAAGILRAAEKAQPRGLVKEDLKIIVIANAGREGQEVRCVTLGELAVEPKRSLSGKAIAFVIPAQMSFAEEENLRFASVRPSS
jgi:diphthine synthase